MNHLYTVVCCGWNGCHSDLEEDEGFGTSQVSSPPQRG